MGLKCEIKSKFKLFFYFYLSCTESKFTEKYSRASIVGVFIRLTGETLHENEQTATVTHSTGVLKGALSSLLMDLLMKADCLSENPCKRKLPNLHASF